MKTLSEETNEIKNAKLVGWSKRFALDSTVASIDEIPFLTKTEKNWFKRRAAVLSL